jgi:hypothetical protein
MDKKILNIDKLKYLDKPVTMGIRINPQTKLTLAAEASKNGLTLSEFVLKMITNKIEISKQTIDSLKENVYLKEKMLTKYETPYLKQLFEKDDLPTYVETHYKINVDHDYIETYLVLYGMKEKIEDLKKRLQQFSPQ